MKPFQLCGLGNAIVDIFVEISDAEFASLGFERGGMVLVDLPAQRILLDRYQKDEPRLASGGSVANSVIAFSQLGGQGAFIGCVGDDRYGLFYAQEFEKLGIEIGNPVIVNEFTGTSVCLVTPDAERTMRTCLGVASHLAARHVDEARIRDSEWLFIEGYVFANPETGQTAILEAIRLAKQHGTKIALTCSDAFVPQVFAAPFKSALEHAELLFCNETEACSITGASGAEDAFKQTQGHRPVGGGDQRPERRLHPPWRHREARRRLSERAEGPDRRRRHVRGLVSLRDYARRPGRPRRPRRELPVAQGDHAGRRTAAPGDQTVLG